ncbi:hypothetical protein LOC68_17800 [Blastopirellula sp. JC732]|uniref:Uncharacterized protein n=1 Tax=Blastopirellula sediminis TaxID=2894196 RepID=A0A9X1SHK8_9BACT|nr:hypothetical protein [Blastopirellula sediminis]MCC9606450.1 hypothetical protein [Blastopirellula sediminis]MCC9630252.1 hypothetical protein [Blastopirellula sediminis]
METDAQQNPFASPHAPQKTRHDLPTRIEGPSPIDVRGYCYACGAAGEEDFQQQFYWGRLVVDYSLCRNCLWRRPWQRASILVNGSLSILGIFVAVYVASLLSIIRLDAVRSSQFLVNGIILFGIIVFVPTSVVVVMNIVFRMFAVFRWYPTDVGKGIYRLTRISRQFRANYFAVEKEE